MSETLPPEIKQLIESHKHPFIVIDADRNILAVNRAWEQQTGVSEEECSKQPCCNNDMCRHQRFFQTLEPYAEQLALEWRGARFGYSRIQGFPLLVDNKIVLGESIIPLALKKQQTKSAMMQGRSEAFLKLKTMLKKAAQAKTPVVLNGETGTGKELAAEFIHSHSPRADREFVVVDCTSISDELFESELFGHEKGAFTGANSQKKGLFELAHQGTLFLDEVAELPASQQAKLLRALEKGQFRRVGGTTIHYSDVRVVCATHRNLSEMVQQGQFREDLFYRLSVFPVMIPPLRQRREDIPVIAQYFLTQIGQNGDIPYTLSKAALRKLIQYEWPGNVRELRNIIQLAATLCEHNIIDADDIQVLHENKSKPPLNAIQVADQSEYLNPVEKIEADFIQQLMQTFNGNRKKIAQEMNISERTLYRKLKRFQLN